MTELLLCPFCGSKARLIGNTGGNYFHVSCQNLEYNVSLTYCHSEEQAIEQWNRRV